MLFAAAETGTAVASDEDAAITSRSAIPRRWWRQSDQ
jgi:hypothetical protein